MYSIHNTMVSRHNFDSFLQIVFRKKNFEPIFSKLLLPSRVLRHTGNCYSVRKSSIFFPFNVTLSQLFPFSFFPLRNNFLLSIASFSGIILILPLKIIIIISLKNFNFNLKFFSLYKYQGKNIIKIC